MTLPDDTARLQQRLQRERRARLEAERIAERSTRELYDREQSFRALFADNPYPMWVYDRDTRSVLEVNSAASASYGYSHDEFLELTTDDLEAGEGRHRLKDGRLVDVEMASHTLRFADRPAVLVLAQDVTARNELAVAKATFLTAVSHELRTPLTALLGFARTLSRHDAELSPGMRRECIDGIASSAQRLDRLLADLLDVDRLSRGVIQARRHPTDVGALVRGVVAEMGATRPIHVDTRPLVAAVDAAMVERIVENLVANALAHTTDVEIWVRVAPRPGGVLICVDDAGPGVPASVRDSVFQAFEHGANLREHAPGMGVGLALVAHFAALHDGRAWIEERAGGGAALRVFLPDA